MPRYLNPLLLSLLCAAMLAAPGLAAAQATATPPAAGGPAAASPLGDLSSYRAIAEDTLKIAKSGDLSAAHKRLKDLETAWDNASDSLKKRSYNKWRSVDNAIDFALDKLSAKKADPAASTKAVQDLIDKLH